MGLKRCETLESAREPALVRPSTMHRVDSMTGGARLQAEPRWVWKASETNTGSRGSFLASLRIMNLDDGDQLVAVVRVPREEGGEVEAAEESAAEAAES